MIVRNGAATLAACLGSVAALCDELIVVDTGSDDDSRSIAHSFGAKVVRTPWVDDFSAVRNSYLTAARCPWILSLDADEMLGDARKSEITAALKRSPSTAFVFRIRNYFLQRDGSEPVLPSKLSGGAPPGIGCLISRTVRLFPRLPSIRYSYPVHESLVPSIRHARLRLQECAIPIHHRGYLDGAEGSRSKAAFYRKLGEKKIAQVPKYFAGYLELGKVHLYEGELETAGRMFAHTIQLRRKCAEAYFFRALTLRRQNRHAECRTFLGHALRRFPGNSDLAGLLDQVERVRQPPAQRSFTA